MVNFTYIMTLIYIWLYLTTSLNNIHVYVYRHLCVTFFSPMLIYQSSLSLNHYFWTSEHKSLSNIALLALSSIPRLKILNLSLSTGWTTRTIAVHYKLFTLLHTTHCYFALWSINYLNDLFLAYISLLNELFSVRYRCYRKRLTKTTVHQCWGRNVQVLIPKL